MVEGYIDIKTLNLEELNGVVSIYPWFGAARKELCLRMSELGEGAWSDEKYAEAALYLGSRRIIAELARKGKETDCSDRNVKGIIESNFEKPATAKPRIILAGGDYFSPHEYDDVRQSEDNIFSSFAKQAKNEGLGDIEPEEVTDFCTETLAEIYLDQQYYDQAREIYSKLSLRYPEKSVYFASLIEKIDKINKR